MAVVARRLSWHLAWRACFLHDEQHGGGASSKSEQAG